MANACGASSAERHRFDEQMDVDLIHRAATVREFTDEPVDGFLVAAENEGRERMGRGGDAGEGFIQSAVGKNWQDRTEHLSFPKITSGLDSHRKAESSHN